MSRKPQANQQRPSVTIRMDEEMKEKVMAQAKTLNMNLRGVINEALAQYFLQENWLSVDYAPGKTLLCPDGTTGSDLVRAARVLSIMQGEEGGDGA